jgi:serine/threonine-protein kinase
MTRCPSCSSVVSEVAAACPQCGKPLDPAGVMPTLEGPAGRAPATPRTPSHPPTPSGYGEARFAPGHVFAERYRIVGLLGRGGMGEVYRADDMKLGHTVALKFLSHKLAADPNLVQRFYSEVRLARQVAHPNVCRVYDVGESDGLLYLSMEYVDGEDLASLLKRIGRLPPGKAVDIARELCAGLAAAHDRGVVHRDLKPANVMLDGRGHARITDFGLAIPLEGGTAERYAGTPASMAPEQLTGRDVTQKTDVYALGLILYEIFTGKRAFEAKSIPERLRALDTARPESVTGIAGTDPAVERAIMRCLEKDPAQRPASALAVAAALPGGDPLAAALAAGETPSPEMVAAAGGESAVPLATAWLLLGGVLLLLAAVMAIRPYSTDIGLARWDKSPAVLEERAREMVARFGYDENPADSMSWMERDYDTLRYLADHHPAPGWRKLYAGLGPPVLVGYRQSPQPLIASGSQAVTASDPPLEVSGMVNVVIDTRGQLRRFRAVPPQLETGNAVAAEFDWSRVFAEAGLDPARFQKREPTWVPPSAFDARAEWTGSIPELPDVPLTASAAAFRGKLVHFELLGPWSGARPELQSTGSGQRIAQGPGLRIAQATIAIVFLLLALASIFFARRNLRQGRGDRKGAFRLAQFLFAVNMLHWAVTSHHAGNLATWVLQGVIQATAFGLFVGSFFWLLYMALEPFLRRRLPELLIGWARLLEGRFRDPRVGRDILIGATAGTGLALLAHVVNGLPTWFALQGQTTIPFTYHGAVTLSLGANPLDYLLAVHRDALGMAFIPVTAYFVLRVLLRRPSLAALGLGVIEVLLNLGGENPRLEVPAAVLTAAVIVFVVTRFGLLTIVSMRYFMLLLSGVAPSFDFSSWYAAYSLPALILLAGLALYAFRISLGEQRVFGRALLEEA